MRKELNPQKINDVIKLIKQIFQLADLCSSDITKAAEMKWNDFEDAVHSTIAERIHADCIITRNVRDFRNSRVTSFTPTEYLSRISF